MQWSFFFSIVLAMFIALPAVEENAPFGASLLKGSLARDAGKPATEMSVLEGLARLGLLTHQGCSETWSPSCHVC